MEYNILEQALPVFNHKETEKANPSIVSKCEKYKNVLRFSNYRI